MKILMFPLVIGLSFAAGAAFAAQYDDETIDKAVEQHNAQAAERDKIVCKRIRQTGTHFKTRVCQKQGDWDYLREEAQRDMRNINSQHDATGSGSG